MPFELHYTSLSRGLAPGSSGFATVAKTADLPPPLQARLESLSGYKEIPGVQASAQPVNWSYLRQKVGNADYAVLSRISFAGADYTGRTNKYAHHLVLSPEECARIPAGPAWLLAQPGVMDSVWRGEARVLPIGRRLPTGPSPNARPASCTAWKRLTGDAGWGGALAHHWKETPEKPVRILCKLDQSSAVLSLIAESLALISPARRWDISFSTYAVNLPRETFCLVRGWVTSDSSTTNTTFLQATERVFDLTRPFGAAPDDDWSAAAREGRFPDPSAKVSRKVDSSATAKTGAFAPVIDLAEAPGTIDLTALEEPSLALEPDEPAKKSTARIVPRQIDYGRGSSTPMPNMRPVVAVPSVGWKVAAIFFLLAALGGWGLLLADRARQGKTSDNGDTAPPLPSGGREEFAGEIAELRRKAAIALRGDHTSLFDELRGLRPESANDRARIDDLRQYIEVLRDRADLRHERDEILGATKREEDFTRKIASIYKRMETSPGADNEEDFAQLSAEAGPDSDRRANIEYLRRYAKIVADTRVAKEREIDFSERIASAYAAIDKIFAEKPADANESPDEANDETTVGGHAEKVTKILAQFSEKAELEKSTENAVEVSPEAQSDSTVPTPGQDAPEKWDLSAGPDSELERFKRLRSYAVARISLHESMEALIVARQEISDLEDELADTERELDEEKKKDSVQRVNVAMRERDIAVERANVAVARAETADQARVTADSARVEAEKKASEAEARAKTAEKNSNAERVAAMEEDLAAMKEQAATAERERTEAMRRETVIKGALEVAEARAKTAESNADAERVATAEGKLAAAEENIATAKREIADAIAKIAELEKRLAAAIPSGDNDVNRRIQRFQAFHDINQLASGCLQAANDSKSMNSEKWKGLWSQSFKLYANKPAAIPGNENLFGDALDPFGSFLADKMPSAVKTEIRNEQQGRWTKEIKGINDKINLGKKGEVSQALVDEWGREKARINAEYDLPINKGIVNATVRRTIDSEITKVENNLKNRTPQQ